MDGNQRDNRAAQGFVGRQAELATLDSALAAARRGEPQVALVQGEAGIGKSSLVFEFLDRQAGAQVITASAEESETVLPYGVLAQLAAGAATISPGAVTGLKLLAQGPAADADPLAVGVDLLALISSVQRKEEPTVLVVEDVQWADLPSARALLFACRRLVADHVLVILTNRPEGMSRLGPGWARFTAGDRRAVRLTLGGLDAPELYLMCQELGHAGLSRRSLQRLANYTGGNPLLARAVLAELSEEMLAADGGLCHLPRSLADLILSQLAALPAAANDLVAAASVLGDHCAFLDAASVGGLAGPAAALEEAARAGFLTQQNGPSGWIVSFTHLLVREAVYSALEAGRRSRLHLRAAAIMDGQEALVHRAAAALGPDPALASELSAAAGGAADEGKLLVAARWLQQAVAVTPRGPDRDDRILLAFELQVRAADVAAADAARPMIERLPASVRRDTALGHLAMLSARPLDAQTLLQAAWDRHDSESENSAGEAAFGLGMLLGISGSFTVAARWLDRALRIATGSEDWYDGARCIRAIPFALSGETGRALSLFRDLPTRAAMVPARHTDALTYRGIARLWSDELPTAAEDLGVAASRIRGGLQVRFPSQPLGFLAEVEFRSGHWDDSRAHAELAVSLAYDAGRDFDLPFAHSLAVPVAACRGDWAAAVGHVEAAEQAAPMFGGFATIFAASARGILGFARDDPGEAQSGAALALSVAEIDRYDDPAAFWWRPMQIWALIRDGQLGEAADILTAFEARVTARDKRSALVHAAWLGGALAMARGDLDQADQVLRDGRRAPGGQAFPFYRGLVDLEHGRCLSRLHRRREAISALHAAHGVFAALAARPFMQASEAGLAAVGLRPRTGGDPVLPGLTAQELRVARLVASGLSNREVAAQLYVSPKTVEYHLVHAFTKLGLRSRHQLAARVRADYPGALT